MDYYLQRHMPGAVERLSAYPGYRGVSVVRGIGGGEPGAEPAYIAMCHYQFDSLDQFLAAFSANSAFLQGDMPNYTDVEAIVQISEVVLSQ
jgi:uncharacterized protein (TIGR02118 family)